MAAKKSREAKRRRDNEVSVFRFNFFRFSIILMCTLRATGVFIGTNKIKNFTNIYGIKFDLVPKF